MAQAQATNPPTRLHVIDYMIDLPSNDPRVTPVMASRMGFSARFLRLGGYLAHAREAVERWKSQRDLMANYGLPAPGTHKRYPFGLAMGVTPTFRSARDMKVAGDKRVRDAFTELLTVPLNKSPWQTFWDAGCRVGSVYVGAAINERALSMSVPELLDLCHLNASLCGKLIGSDGAVCIDASGDIMPGSLAEYLCLTMQRLGVTLEVEPEMQIGIWTAHPPATTPAIVVGSSLFRSRLVQFGEVASDTHPLFRGPHTKVILEEGTPDAIAEYRRWYHRFPKVQLMSPEFTPELLEML